MFWTYNQHLVFQSTSIWFVYSDFRFSTKFCCRLKLTMSIAFFDSLPEWAFWFLYKSFVFWGMFLYRTETKLFSKSAWALAVDILLQISNLNWSQWIGLQLWYINFFGPNFLNFVLIIVFFIWRWSLKPFSKEIIFINESLEFLISKSMHKPPSPLKNIFCFIIL